MPSDSKAVIFSQWTSMLNLLGKALAAQGYRCSRLDGSMAQPARQKALCDFEHDPNSRIMLLSLKAGGLGLTMTWANVRSRCHAEAVPSLTIAVCVCDGPLVVSCGGGAGHRSCAPTRADEARLR